MALARWVGRAVGLDVYREFCEVAICEDGRTRSAGRVRATPDGIRLLGEGLLGDDRVALEVTGSCWEVSRLLEPHVNRVIVVSPDKRERQDPAIARPNPALWAIPAAAAWRNRQSAYMRQGAAFRARQAGSALAPPPW